MAATAVFAASRMLEWLRCGAHLCRIVTEDFSLVIGCQHEIRPALVAQLDDQADRKVPLLHCPTCRARQRELPRGQWYHAARTLVLRGEVVEEDAALALGGS
eukprot:SAG31_NODE_2235_length_6123_cov_2.723274_4_plen_102_part_00